MSTYTGVINCQKQSAFWPTLYRWNATVCRPRLPKKNLYEKSSLWLATQSSRGLTVFHRRCQHLWLNSGQFRRSSHWA